MKKVIILILAALLLLGGCRQITDEPTGTSIPAFSEPTQPAESPWWEQIKTTPNSAMNWMSPVVELEGFFFYITDGGMWGVNAATQESHRILPRDVYGVYVYRGEVYYCTDSTIYRMITANGPSEPIWSLDQLSEGFHNEGRILDFRVYNGSVYIVAGGLTPIRYDMNSKKTTTFLNESINSMAFSGDYCYYIPHAARSFSIYRMDMQTGEKVLVRGDGQEATNNSSNKWVYDHVSDRGGEVYFSVRIINDIFRYVEGHNDEVVMDHSASLNASDIYIIEHACYPNLCWYTLVDGNLTVYEYTDGKANVLLTLENVDVATARTLTITESCIFWCPSDTGIMQCKTK